jgi:thiamine-monophosphate kinase
LKQAHLRPQPRVKEGQSLVRAGIVTAIDISDGLLADLRHICDASKVSAIIHEASMPLHPSLNAVFKKECMDIALGGGEDYELLFTGTSETVLKAANTIQCPITVIGEIISQSTEPVTVLTGDGQSIKPVHTGWNHLLQHRIVHD